MTSEKCISQIQLRPAPPGLLRGICPPCQSQGLGHLQILWCPGAGHFPAPGPFPSFWHARGFLSECSYTADYFTGKESRLAHLSRTAWGKAEEGCKGMFLILCMHFFIDYQARITQRNRELSTWINVFWLSNQISVDIIWKTTSRFIKLFINITLQRSIYFNVNNLHKYLIINWCMSSRLLQRKTLIETKNRTLKCLKWHYSTVRSGGFDISRAPTPENLPSKAKNMPKSGG